MAKQHLLISTHTEEFEYDAEKVLTFLGRNPHLVELYGATSDEDKIIHVFNAVNGSALGDELFSSTASDDFGQELIVRDDDE